MADVLAVVSLALALLSLGVAAAALTRTRRRRPDRPLPEDVRGLREEVAALRTEARGALSHVAVVRYDAFGDMGGQLSWSLALLDAAGDGLVLTSIHGRSEARSYAKNVNAWRPEQPLSPEEEEALTHARG